MLPEKFELEKQPEKEEALSSDRQRNAPVPKMRIGVEKGNSHESRTCGKQAGADQEHQAMEPRLAVSAGSGSTSVVDVAGGLLT